MAENQERRPSLLKEMQHKMFDVSNSVLDAAKSFLPKSHNMMPEMAPEIFRKHETSVEGMPRVRSRIFTEPMSPDAERTLNADHMLDDELDPYRATGIFTDNTARIAHVLLKE